MWHIATPTPTPTLHPQCVQHSVPECRRLTLFSWVKTILTSWKGLFGYDRDDMSCQDFCAVCLFHPITPSVSSMWFVLSRTYMLYFLVFLFFCDDFTKWVYYCESAIMFCGPQIPPVPFNPSLAVHELWCIYQNNICFWRLWSMGFKLLVKHNFISNSNAPIFIYKQCRTRESI